MPILPILTLLFTLAITFCKKTLHSFFHFAQYNLVHISPNCSTGALTFVTFSAAHSHPAMDAAAMKPPPQPSSSPSTSAASVPASKRDPGGNTGFVDHKVDGWMSCTESLGFESSDEWVAEKDIENWIDHRHQCGANAKANAAAAATPRKRKSLSSSSAKEKKSFPPPLSSLDGNGYPTFFLRPVRKDGRLELTEVKIDRPHVLLASRQDGRLRLHLVLSRDRVDNDAAVEEDEQSIHQREEEEEEEEEAVEEYEKQKEKDSEWLFPVGSGGVDGLRRCHELASHHGHHELHGWSQPCVTIR